jgi:hypothetical protein
VVPWVGQVVPERCDALRGWVAGVFFATGR